MGNIKILYDGWPLSREPDSPAALQLYTLLALLPPEVEPLVAIPDPPPIWLEARLCLVEPASHGASARLVWEQRTLSSLARRSGVQLLHGVSPSAPLFGRSISVVSPGGFDGPWSAGAAGEGSEGRDQRGARDEGLSIARRLQESLAQGGLARARAIFWPEDLPQPHLPARLIPLPPVLHPDFFSPLQDTPEPGAIGAGLFPELPETFILYHGPTNRSWLLRLLEAWSWAAGAIGDYYPLLILGLDSAAGAGLSRLLEELQMAGTVRALPVLPTPALAAIYQRCTALFHPAPLSPWGCPVRAALACGKPVVALESPYADAVAGPAAYLAPAGQDRSLGAALITVVVEPEVSENLSRQARARAAAWQDNGSGGEGRFGARLAAAYRLLTPPSS
jgi:hypothetical protein